MQIFIKNFTFNKKFFKFIFLLNFSTFYKEHTKKTMQKTSKKNPQSCDTLSLFVNMCFPTDV